MADFEGKRYVVTGAASGIGHAVAERLLAAGAEVVCLDRNTPTATVTRHIEVDLANPHSIDAAVEQLDGTVRRPDERRRASPAPRRPTWCWRSTASRCVT